MGETRTLIQVRLPRDLVRQLDHVRIELELTRTAFIERLLKAGLGDYYQLIPRRSRGASPHLAESMEDGADG